VRGTVVEFDEHAGYGTVRSREGGEYFFHCTAIADGTRRIDRETQVRFAVVPGRRGLWEAAHLEPA
jgi:cold shock CspA family protein